MALWRCLLLYVIVASIESHTFAYFATTWIGKISDEGLCLGLDGTKLKVEGLCLGLDGTTLKVEGLCLALDGTTLKAHALLMPR